MAMEMKVKRILCMLACLMLLSATGCSKLLARVQAPGPASDVNNVLQPSTADTEEAMLDGGPVMSRKKMYTFGIAAEAPQALGYTLPQPTEEYPVMQESGFVATVNHALSTFAADVDTASYANIRRMIRLQQQINPDAVRVEEMINSFSYHYGQPEGDAPVAVDTQVAPCPWNAKNVLMRVGLQARRIETDALPPSNLVFLIDVSGSMESADKLPLVRRSFALLVEQLSVRDRVSIVVYAGEDAVILEGVRGDEQARILQAIHALEAGGSTNGASGILTAYKIAEAYAGEGINSRVILATDGDFNVGASSENDLIRLIEGQRDKGIFLTVMGFGYGNLKDNKLEALADHGNGNCTYIDTIHQARRALVEEMGATFYTVAKDVKIQVEFNPAVVEGYRLIGYENRRLADEDFADDAKDGGELGSGHSVTALYEIVPAGSGIVPGIALTYQKTEQAGSADYATVHVRYKQPTGHASTEIVQRVPAQAWTQEPDADFCLTSAVAAFGQMLSGSAYKGTADADLVLSLIQPLLSGDQGGRIVELADLVRKSQGLYQ